MIKRYFSRFPHALRGISYAILNDFGFRTQFYGIGLFLILLLYLLAPLTSENFLFIVLAYSLILITELQNSALEIALNELHPQLHPAIGVSKDLAAGAVLIAGIFLLIVVLTIFYQHHQPISTWILTLN